jgi:hypothetical protein
MLANTKTLCTTAAEHACSFILRCPSISLLLLCKLPQHPPTALGNSKPMLPKSAAQLHHTALTTCACAVQTSAQTSAQRSHATTIMWVLFWLMTLFYTIPIGAIQVKGWHVGLLLSSIVSMCMVAIAIIAVTSAVLCALVLHQCLALTGQFAAQYSQTTLMTFSWWPQTLMLVFSC